MGSNHEQTHTVSRNRKPQFRCMCDQNVAKCSRFHLCSFPTQCDRLDYPVMPAAFQHSLLCQQRELTQLDSCSHGRQLCWCRDMHSLRCQWNIHPRLIESFNRQIQPCGTECTSVASRNSEFWSFPHLHTFSRPPSTHILLGRCLWRRQHA